MGQQIDALLDEAGLTLREALRRVEQAGIPFPYRTAGDWKGRDKVPPGGLAARRWETFVAVCKASPEEDDMDGSPRGSFKVVGGSPNANLSAIEHYVVRLNEIESMVRDLREELVVLARDIAKRKRGNS